MLKRWTPAEDKRIATQLGNDVQIAKVVVPGRKKGDIRKRAYRIGLIEPYKPMIARRTLEWSAVKRCLEGGAKTLKQLAASSGLSQDTVRGVLKRNRSEVHISGRVVDSPTGRRHATTWSLGAGDDAAPFNGDDSLAAALFEAGRDPEAAMIAEARQRLREVEARGELIRRDPFVAALFGRYQPAAQINS